MKAVISVVIVGIAIGLYLKPNQTDSTTTYETFQENWSASSALVNLPTNLQTLLNCKESRVYDQIRFSHPESSMPGAEHYDFLSPLLSSGNPSTDLVIDVGANIGAIGLFSASYGYKTVMVEPIPHNIQILASAIICNTFNNATLITRPASDSSSTSVDISDNVSLYGQYNGQILEPGQAVEHNVHSITTIRLDSILPYLPIFLLKLDVEGYEALALKGMTGLLSRNLVKYIHTEFSPGNMLPVSGIHGREYLELLWKHNFRVFVEECSHNIDDNARAALGSLCKDNLTTADLANALVNEEYDRLENRMLTPSNIDSLILTLVNCEMGKCLLNLIAARV